MYAQEYQTVAQTATGRIRSVAVQHQLIEHSASLADLSIKTIKSARRDDFTVAGKMNALIALYAKISECYALVEFIDSLYLDDKGRSQNMREELKRRHAAAVRNLERSLADSSARTGRMLQTCVQACDEVKVLPFGETAPKGLTSEHARVMKDLVVMRYLSHLGIVSKSASRNDL